MLFSHFLSVLILIFNQDAYRLFSRYAYRFTDFQFSCFINNSDYEKIEGVTLIRDDEANFPEGAYHLVCEVLVRHVDGTYLLMKRSPNKNWPGMWEATAGGSALKGETDVEGAYPQECRQTAHRGG